MANIIVVIMMGKMMYIEARVRPAVAAGGPGSWGFEGPEAVQPRVRSNGVLLQMRKASCVDISNVGDFRAGTSSVVGAGTAEGPGS